MSDQMGCVERILAALLLIIVAGLFVLWFNMRTVFGQANPNCTEFGADIHTKRGI